MSQLRLRALIKNQVDPAEASRVEKVRVKWQLKALLPVVLVLLGGLLLFTVATVSFRNPERSTILMLAGAGAIVICGVSIVVLAYLIQRPMVELQEKVALISEGNLNVAVSFSGGMTKSETSDATSIT